MSRTAFVVKNLFNYETIIAPPINLPSDMVTFYITDSDENVNTAISLGWNNAVNVHDYIVQQFPNVETDKMERRRVVARINIFPHEFVSELIDFDFVFVCDSNITVMWKEYADFVNAAKLSDAALFVTSGYYSGERDTIIAEARASIENGRWSYNHVEISMSASSYINILRINGKRESSVVSAKYIGWNLKHNDYEFLSNEIYNQSLIHLQGNIILTFFASLFPHRIYNHYTNTYTGGKLNPHNYEA